MTVLILTSIDISSYWIFTIHALPFWKCWRLSRLQMNSCALQRASRTKGLLINTQSTLTTPSPSATMTGWHRTETRGGVRSPLAENRVKKEVFSPEVMEILEAKVVSYDREGARLPTCKRQGESLGKGRILQELEMEMISVRAHSQERSRETRPSKIKSGQIGGKRSHSSRFGMAARSWGWLHRYTRGCWKEGRYLSPAWRVGNGEDSYFLWCLSHSKLSVNINWPSQAIINHT